MFWKHTRYVEALACRDLPATSDPAGAGYSILFDETLATGGFRELRVWVHVSIRRPDEHPVTPNTRLVLRFLHCFGTAECYDYEQCTLSSRSAAHINGYGSVPVIGDRTRVLCHPENLPPGPYDLFFNYYLVR